MTRVPNIRGYEGFAEGVNWTKKLSLETFIAYINSDPSSSLDRLFPRWLGRNHSNFTGYSDERFDAINTEGFEELLELNLRDDRFIPIKNRLMDDEVYEEGIPSLFDFEWGFTLGMLLDGKANNFSLDMEDSDENKALIGELVGESLLRGEKGNSYIDRLVIQFIEDAVPQGGKIITSAKDITTIRNVLKDANTIRGLESVVSGYINALKEGFTIMSGEVGEAYLPGGKGERNIPLKEFLAGFYAKGDGYITQDSGGVGPLLLKRYRDRGSADNPYYTKDGNEPKKVKPREMSIDDYSDYLVGLPKVKLINQLNRTVKKILEDRLNSIVQYNASFLNTVFAKVDAQINNSMVTAPTPNQPAGQQYRRGQVGQYSKLIDDDVLVDWFIRNEPQEIQRFENFLAGIQKDYYYENNDWNPLEIAGIKGSSSELRRKEDSKSKNFIPNPEAGVQNMTVIDSISDAISDRDAFEEQGGLEKIETFFEQGGFMDELAEFFNGLDDKAKENENLYSVADDERFFPDLSTLSETERMDNLIDRGDSEEIETLLQDAIEQLNRVKVGQPGESPEGDTLLVSEDEYEEVQGFTRDIRKVRRTIRAVPRTNINSYNTELVRVLNELGKNEEADKVKDMDLNDITENTFNSLTGMESSEGGRFIEFIRDQYLEGSRGLEQRKKLAKLLLSPILYNDSSINTIGENQVNTTPASILYAGKLVIEHEHDETGLTSKFSFNGKKQIKPQIGTQATNFSIRQGATRMGEMGFLPTGDKLIGKFETAFNKDRDNYKNAIFKKLIKVKAIMGEQ